MKFTVQRAKLLDALLQVQNIVPPRPSLQILSNVKIVAEGGKITFTTTDVDMSISCTIEANVAQDGATTLPMRRLASIVRELAEGEIAVDVDDNDTASLSCGASSFFRIKGIAVSDFPKVQQDGGDIGYTIDAETFAEMLHKTSYAASTDESRRVLTGVLLSFKDAKLTVVATDGRRLALVEHEVEFPPEAAKDLVLPSKTVSELGHLLKGEGPVHITSQGTMVVFTIGGTTLCSKLYDGSFPNYRLVIPQSCDERIAIPRTDMLAALRRVAVVLNDKTNAAGLTFGDGRVVLETSDSDIGEAREEVAIKYSGEPLSYTFNSTYIMDALRNLEDEEVYFEVSRGHGPTVIKCGIPFLYVLMPIRTN